MQLQAGWQQRTVNRVSKTVLAVIIIVVLAHELGNGIVLDDDTLRPLQGAMVIATWQARGTNLVHGYDTCFKVDSAQSDASGKFRISMLSGNFNPLIFDRERTLHYYRPGYLHVAERSIYPWLVRMKADTSAPRQRIEAIRDIAKRLGCGPERQQRIVLLPIYRAMLAEAESIDADLTGSAQWYVDELAGRRR